MMTSVHLAVARLNAAASNVGHLELHQGAVEL